MSSQYPAGWESERCGPAARLHIRVKHRPRLPLRPPDYALAYTNCENMVIEALWMEQTRRNGRWKIAWGSVLVRSEARLVLKARGGMYVVWKVCGNDTVSR